MNKTSINTVGLNKVRLNTIGDAPSHNGVIEEGVAPEGYEIFEATDGKFLATDGEIYVKS